MKNLIRDQIVKLKNSVKNFSPFKKLSDAQIKLTSDKPLKIGGVKSKVQYPKNNYVGLQSYLQTFYNSTSQNGRVNGQHLTFVTGAQNSGKTSLIKQSLQIFRKRKGIALISKNNKKQIPFTTISSPQYMEDLQRQTKLDNQFSVIIQFDFNDNFIMRPQAFFNHIHKKIIKQLLKIATQVKNKKNIKLLDAQIVKQIVIAQNSRQYIFMFVKDVIYSILSDCDGIKLSAQALKKLQALNEKIIQVSDTTFFKRQLSEQQMKQYLPKNKQKQQLDVSLYHQVVKILRQDKKISQLQASLLLFLSVFKRIEYEHRPQSHLYRSYETGIQSTTYLFSILNYICGFGRLNKSTLSKVIHEQVNHLGNSFVGKGNHVDVVMALMHLQKLSCYKDTKFNEWFDNMIIQLHNSSNLRSHFPVVLELPDSYTLKQMQQLGRFQVDNPTVIEIPGYFKTNMHRYSISMIMNQTAIKLLFPVLGRNPSTWNQILLQLSKGVPILDIQTAKAQVMQKRKLKLQSKLNKLFIESANLPYIDDNTLKYHIIQFLRIFRKCKGYMKTQYLQQIQQIFNNPIFVQLYTNKILYDHYYEIAVDFVDMRDLIYTNEILQKMSILDRLRYRKWRILNRPYLYNIRQLKYNDAWEEEYMKKSDWQTQRSDYMNRQQYGRLNDYKVRLYEDVYKQTHNL